LLAPAGAHVLRVLARAKSCWTAGAGIICFDVSLTKDECRRSAKFRGRILLIYLGLQNGRSPALHQHGKLFACGTPEVQISKTS
jgi:hypothetical protein